MPRHLSRLRAAARLGLLPALAASYYRGLCVGEIGDFLITVPFILISAALLACLITVGSWRRLLTALLLGGLGLSVWQFGENEAARAFNECVDRGETVRQALADYHAAHGQYPPDLAQALPELPCRPRFGNTLLHYKASASTYSLHFGDALISHHASEAAAFTASK